MYRSIDFITPDAVLPRPMTIAFSNFQDRFEHGRGDAPAVAWRDALSAATKLSPTQDCTLRRLVYEATNADRSEELANRTAAFQDGVVGDEMILRHKASMIELRTAKSLAAAGLITYVVAYTRKAAVKAIPCRVSPMAMQMGWIAECAWQPTRQPTRDAPDRARKALESTVSPTRLARLMLDLAQGSVEVWKWDASCDALRVLRRLSLVRLRRSFGIMGTGSPRDVFGPTPALLGNADRILPQRAHQDLLVAE